MSDLAALGPEHAGLMAALHAEAFDRPWSAAEFETLLASSGVGALGVESGGALAGFILVRAIAGEAEILTLAVAPAARRRGVGRDLVEAGAGTALALGADVLWLEVAEDNAAALALYAAAGFDIAGRRRGYYARREGPAADAVVMRRVLNSGGSLA